jgi:hypothetical protein
MTKIEFVALCAERTIDPKLALENESIVEALQNRNDALVVELLDNEF